MNNLVSVIIPCFNAERWVREAIDSCLKQTYQPIEVVVIDDGSTDRSFDIIKSYRNRIIWETGSNRGGNCARNRGFTVSTGKYIQFLDADDYILPKKIARQVGFLEQTGADVVYGDWRHQEHLVNGKIVIGEIQVTGVQPDILEALLADWWVSPACLLFTRDSVAKSGGWDENLKAGQDRDFFLSVVMSGANVVYQPGCYSIYRRYGKVTVSTSSKTRYLENHQLILKKAEQRLTELGEFSPKYKQALAQSYFKLSRGYLGIEPTKYRQLLGKTLELYPNFQACSQDRTKLFSLLQALFGFRPVEAIISNFKILRNLWLKL